MVEIGSVVLEKKMEMRKDYDNDDNNDMNNDDGQRKHFYQKSSLESMAQIGAKKPVKSRKTTQSL